jgi:phosphoesterase RecJ-like protein
MNPAQQLRRFAEEAQRVLLTGPEDADGDSIGATLALARGIEALGAKEVLVAADTPARYRWMPGAESILPNASVASDFDLVIVMDGDRHRLAPQVDLAFKAAARTVVVDHHRTTSAEGYDLAIVDHTAAATCTQVLGILDDWAVPMDSVLAQLLYVGLIYDTGGFRYSNTKPETHHAAARLLATGIDHASIASRVLMEVSRAGMALKAGVLRSATFHGDGQMVLGSCSTALMRACGADTGDLDGLVESLLYVEGAELSVLMVERGPESVKLSLRSRGAIDVAALAKRLDSGGGGHAKAAGVVLSQSLEGATGFLPTICLKALAADKAAQK